jgi:uncharacterized protein (TIGR03435 family)
MRRVTGLFMCFGVVLALAPGALAEGPLKFDVASVKALDVNATNGGGQGGRRYQRGGPGTNDPGRFDVHMETMDGLVVLAFGLEQGQLIDPGWSRRTGPKFYDVIATMPANTTKAQFQTMLQNLLAERFHLVVHHETRAFAGYELVMDKGGAKLNGLNAPLDDSAQPANSRGDFQNRNAGRITSRGKTMEDLTKQLGMALWTARAIQDQDVTQPIPRVVDKTGLTGSYTFVLNYSPPGSTPADAATDLQDLFVTLREQLGLRLNKAADIPMDVIVLDSVDTVPTPD